MTTIAYLLPFVYNLLDKNKPETLNKEEFSRWLTGFIDGEGNFQVFMDRVYLRVMFRIRLHIDDIGALYNIKEFLGIGRIIKDGDSCVFIISNVNDLINVLFPLIDNYKLFTTKWLDYNDFKSVAMYLSKSNTTSLLGHPSLWAKAIISGMNSSRTVYNYSNIPLIEINPYWLLGFIEAEGTFGIKNMIPYFQLGQHNRNLPVLRSIALFLNSLPKSFFYSIYTTNVKVSEALNKRTGVTVISINNIDTLYDYLLFFLLTMPFQTRKKDDFLFWCIVLHLHKWGFIYLSEGLELVHKISLYINKNRYSNSSNIAELPSLDSIKKVLKLPLTIPLTPEMRHTELGQAYSRINKIKSIWVYNNGKLIGGSPFSSQAAALSAIGYPKSSKVIRMSINTGKLIGYCYTFYSNPL